MRIIPARELRDGARASGMCRATGGPVCVTESGRSDTEVMGAEAYDATRERSSRGEVVAVVAEGVSAVQRGEARDVIEAASGIRRNYGL